MPALAAIGAGIVLGAVALVVAFEVADHFELNLFQLEDV